MMNNSLISQQKRQSPLAQTEYLRPKGGTSEKSLVRNLLLTSLIDVFSILVIYLLVNTSSSQQIFEDKLVEKLPLAKHSQMAEKGLIVGVEPHQFTINSEPVARKDLIDTLKDLREKEKFTQLIIEGDKKNSFAPINEVLRAGSAAGFEIFRFAVLQGGTG